MTVCRYIVSDFHHIHILRTGNYCLEHLGEKEHSRIGKSTSGMLVYEKTSPMR